MKVIYADDHDAKLAVTAIYRLGSIAAAQRTVGSVPSPLQLDLDRRYEQLIECFELRIRSIKVADLSRYLWAVTTLRVVDEEQAKIVFNEYIRRLASDDDSCAMTMEEGAAILWAVGCLKDTYSWTSVQLINLLIEHLNEGEISDLPVKLIVRVLWSLAVHNRYDSDICNEGLASIESKGFENISGSNAINLLWSIAQFKGLIDHQLICRFMGRIVEIIEDRKKPLGITEIRLAADALSSLHETIQRKLNQPSVNLATSNKLSELEALSLPLQKAMESLVTLFTEIYDSSSSFSISFILSILRVAVGAKIIRPEIWDFALLQLQHLLKSSASITIIESANLLEMIAYVPNLSLPSQAIKVTDNNDTAVSDSIDSNSSEIVDSSSPIRHLLPGLTKDPNWHGVAGRLAAITATNAGQVKDKTCLINACWAVASLGYPYRKLLTAVRKSIQFALHELPPSLLSRLVVAVAAEECLVGSTVTAGTSDLSASPKLDREFVDQVALSVYYNLADITPLNEQISAMFAVACLGRLTSFEMRPSPATPSTPSLYVGERKSGERRQVTITSAQLDSLSTSVLIELLWAMHRLPVGVVETLTMESVRLQINKRDLSLLSGQSLGGKVTKDDLKLYVRVLSELKIPGGFSKPESFAARACNSLLLLLQQDPEQSEDISKSRDTFVLSQIAAEAASLCDALQSFIDFQWHQSDAFKFLEKQCASLTDKFNTFPQTENSCICAYHLGRLENLIKLFKNAPPVKSAESRYGIGKQISRWLGIQ